MKNNMKGRIKAQAQHQLPLLCAMCMYIVDDGVQVQDAVTILNGNAVCHDHIYLVRDNNFMRRVAFAKGERP